MKNLPTYEDAEPRPSKSRTRRRITLALVGIATLALVFMGAVGVRLWNSPGRITAVSPVEATLFTPEGTPISSDPLIVAGVEVAQPVVNIGLQPLNTAVDHVFELRNTGSTPVTLGKAKIEVLQGCCPSDPILKATRIEPGAEAPLTFSLPMGMHKGMDGPHLFRVTVPVTNAGGETGNVEVYVKGDFRAGTTPTP